MKPARAARLLALASVFQVLCLAPATAQIGETDFVDGNSFIPESVLLEIGDLLPERANTGSAYLSEAHAPDLLITEDTTLTVHFVWEGSGYKNSLGYFTYTTDPLTIVDRQLIFPNASLNGKGGLLEVGDNSVLRDSSGVPRTFHAGERVGFFLVAKSWPKDSAIANWDALTATLPSLDPATNEASSKGKGTFTSVDLLNPENAGNRPDISRHVAMIAQPGGDGFLGDEPYVVVGIEDQDRRNGDIDFNDVVFLLNASASGAVDTGTTYEPGPPDDDSDGVTGTDDHYPNDAERAHVSVSPAFGWSALGLEDLYPQLGDGDYNDTVLAYRFDTVKNAQGFVKEILGTFHLLARGASLDHRLGIHFPGLPSDATGTIQVERFLSDDDETHVVEPVTPMEDLINLESRRLETVLPHSSLAMPNVPGKFVVNTDPLGTIDRMGASSRFLMTFDTAIDPALLGQAPYDIYWLVNDGFDWVDIHLAGQDAFDDHPEGYPDETGPTAFLDAAGYPWLLDVPYAWQFPLESISVFDAFPHFKGWAASHGTSQSDWYETPVNADTGHPTEAYLVSRDWSVKLPTP